MSTAAVSVEKAPVAQKPAALSLVPETGVETIQQTREDFHPAVVVGIAIVIALASAVLFVGSIVFWLAVRHSGVVAP
ncbi:MAG TPA: hypothetical protein VLT16_18645 [Candidatus Limnocylindrales bacterium]|nr:hypothetical protein [Candidatus Limnocylindrales bacterium]